MPTSTGHLTGKGGIKLFYRTWIPDHPKGCIVLSHGLAEHSGRYHHVAEHFNRHGLAVYAIDHRGHGQSEGKRCFVDRFQDYLDDLDLLVDLATRDHGTPLLLGHSMGGLIAFRYAQLHSEKLKALVLSSPWLETAVQPTAFDKILLAVAGKLFPAIRVPGKVPPNAVAHDPQVVEAYVKDPLNLQFITPGLFLACVGGQGPTREGAAAFSLPLLMLQAGDDRLVKADVSQATFERVPSKHKAFKLYPGLYHEIMNEPEKEQVLKDITDWLAAENLI